MSFLVSLSRVGIDDDSLYEILFCKEVLPHLSTLEARSAGYVLSAYVSIECQRRRRFELQGLESIPDTFSKCAEELLDELRSKAASMAVGASSRYGMEHLRVLVNFAYEFARLDAGTGSEAHILTALETAIRENISGDVIASSPHSVALAASAFSGVPDSLLMNDRLPAMLREPHRGRRPLEYFSSRDLSLLASAAVKHSQLSGSTQLAESVISYVMAEDGLFSSGGRRGFSRAFLASLAETLSPVDPRVIEELSAAERNTESISSTADEICALCEASTQSGVGSFPL